MAQLLDVSQTDLYCSRCCAFLDSGTAKTCGHIQCHQYWYDISSSAPPYAPDDLPTSDLEAYYAATALRQMGAKE